MMMALTVSMAANATEMNDTVVIDKAEKVVVATSETEQQVSILGKQDDKNYVYSTSVPLDKSEMKKRKKTDDDDDEPSNWDFDFLVGLGVPTNVPDGMSFNPLRSKEWAVGLRYVYTPKKALQSYSVGLWFDWRAYGLSTDKMFVKGEGKVIGLGEYPEKAGSKRSSIDVLSLSVPLLFTHRFGHQGKVRMTLGPVVNFNVRGRINNSYEIGDDEIEVSTKDIEYRPITVDLMGAVSYCNIGLYVKYSPMSVLKKDKGPDFHSLTFGFMF